MGTRVLVGLYEEPERPANAIDYVKKYLGAPTGVDVEELRAENDELKRQNAELEAKVQSLTLQIKELQQEQEEGMAALRPPLRASETHLDLCLAIDRVRGRV